MIGRMQVLTVTPLQCLQNIAVWLVFSL